MSFYANAGDLFRLGLICRLICFDKHTIHCVVLACSGSNSIHFYSFYHPGSDDTIYKKRNLTFVLIITI